MLAVAAACGLYTQLIRVLLWEGDARHGDGDDSEQYVQLAGRSPSKDLSAPLPAKDRDKE